MTSRAHRIAYYRVSTADQSVAMQRAVLERSAGSFDKEFADEGVSGGVMAAARPSFADMLRYVRSGDTIYLYALDRLGRDSIDIQGTVRRMLDMGVGVHIENIGLVSRGVGEIVLAVLAQVADLERQKIIARTKDGRAAAREALAANGVTHRGKTSLGRPRAGKPDDVVLWRNSERASISRTAKEFGLSAATVKRYCAR